MSKLTEYWKKYSPREQKLALLMFAVVGGGLLLQLLATAIGQRESQSRQLLTYQREQVQLETLAKLAAGQGRPTPTARLQGDELLAHLRAQPESKALALSLSGPETISGQGKMAFDSWLPWLARLQSSQGLYPLRAEIQGGEEAGMVKLSFELGRPR